MTRYVSLFRGINVGGHQLVRMDTLKELHTSLNLQDVQTYIQSGNVVFASDNPNVTQIQKDIEDGFAQKFGFQVKVMVRTAGEFNMIIENNPFQNQPVKESKWVVAIFLASDPISTALEDIKKTYTALKKFTSLARKRLSIIQKARDDQSSPTPFLRKN